ncbi:MAG: IPTL-CTERM sorting domain-containing protein [Acidobacteriota bacterium]
MPRPNPWNLQKPFFLLGFCLALGVAVGPVGATNYTVTTLSDAIANDGQCSLREAIQEANNGADTDCAGLPSPGDDTIVFTVSGTITLSSTLPNILDAATVGALTIDGSGQSVTISGDSDGDGFGNVRVMYVNSGGNLTLQNLTIAYGYVTNVTGYGAGIYNAAGATLTVINCTFSKNWASNSFGGGIYNAAGGTLTVTNSVFRENSAFWGGGMYNSGTTNVTTTTFWLNSAAAFGGGIENDGGTLSITNCTFDNNSANNYGGGIENKSGGTLNVTNSTFNQNSAGNGGGGINGAGSGTMTVINSTLAFNTATWGGGIFVGTSHTATLKNTIIANSTGGGDCYLWGGTVTGNNNLIKDTTYACGLINGSNGNIIGVDPSTGPLTGSPAYFPLNPGSPAIDAGDPITCSNPPVSNQSQNGITRPQDGDGNGSAICDIGSFEAPAVLVSQADMAVDAWVLPASAAPGQTTTGWGFVCVNNGPDAATNATCSISASAGTITNLNCNPAVPVPSLASGSFITCTFDFTAPGTPGGSDTPETEFTLTITAGASTSDPNAANNTSSPATPGRLLDALNDTATFPANTSQSYNVGSNDQYGNGSLPPGVNFTLTGTTCASASINSTTGVATFTVPPSGSCVVAYQVCLGPACDTAQLTVTAQQQLEPIPTLDEWGLAALVLLIAGAGLLLVRRVVA